jgi:hypothetical protein
MKKISAKTMVDLRAKIFKAEGWTRQNGESYAARIKTAYHVCFDTAANRIIATRKET